MSFRQRQFATLLALSALSFLIMVGVALPASQDLITQRTVMQMETVADLKMLQVQQWLQQGRNVAHLTAMLSCVQDSVSGLSNYLEVGTLERNNLCIELKYIAAIYASVRSISLLHPSTGQVLFSTDPTQAGRERGDETYFYGGKHALYVSSMVYSVGREAPVLNISAPVQSETGTLLAVVVVEMISDDFSAFFSRHTGLGETERVFLVDAYGFYVTLPAGMEGNPFRTIVKSEGVQRALAGQNGHAVYSDMHGTRLLGVYRWLEEGNLGLLIEIEEAELTGQIISIWVLIALVSVGFLVLSVVVARYLARWLVAPLERIVGATRALQAGKLDYRAPLDGPDEIRQLAGAFNEMADSLQIFYQDLEQLVEQRTRELQKERDKAQQYLDVAGVMIVALDSSRKVALINQTGCKILGYGEKDILGQNWFDHFLPKSRKEEATRIFELLMRGEVEMAEWVESEIRTQSGERRTILWHNAILREESGRITGTLSSGEDITERKAAQRRAFELAVEKERVQLLAKFIGDASHDLKTPLTTMKVSLAVLKKTAEPAKQNRHLEILEMQAGHLEKLLEDLLHMSRLDQAAALEFRPLELNDLVRRVVERHRPLAEQKGHELSFLPLDGTPIVKADKAQLERAIAAILTNALNYTPSMGAVEIRIYRHHERHQVVIEVKDTGIGIGKAHLPYIFNRFYRADEARNTAKGGFGLGLTMAKKIVEAHQGRIEVESKVGTGSVFKIVLDLEREALLKKE